MPTPRIRIHLQPTYVPWPGIEPTTFWLQTMLQPTESHCPGLRHVFLLWLVRCWQPWCKNQLETCLCDWTCPLTCLCHHREECVLNSSLGPRRWKPCGEDPDLQTAIWSKTSPADSQIRGTIIIFSSHCTLRLFVMHHYCGKSWFVKI